MISYGFCGVANGGSCCISSIMCARSSMNWQKKGIGGHVVSCQQQRALPWANLLVVILVVEFCHEIQQPLAIAAENVEHLQLLRSKQNAVQNACYNSQHHVQYKTLLTSGCLLGFAANILKMWNASN